MRSANTADAMKAALTLRATPPLPNEVTDWVRTEAIALARLTPIRPADKGLPPLLYYAVTGPQAFPLTPDGRANRGQARNCNRGRS